MASCITPTRRTRAGWTASGACTSGSTARHSAATRPASGGAATTSTTASETMDTRRNTVTRSPSGYNCAVLVGGAGRLVLVQQLQQHLHAPGGRVDHFPHGLLRRLERGLGHL